MRRGRVVALLLAAVLAAVGLAACGGGGSGTSMPAASASTTPATMPTRRPRQRPRPRRPPRPRQDSDHVEHRRPPPPSPPKPRRIPRPRPLPSGSGGGAASFRAPSGDNSIPDYGSEAPPSERERAAVALAAFLRARAGGDWATACTYLAATTRTQLERLLGGAKAKAGGCARVLAELSKSTRGPRRNAHPHRRRRRPADQGHERLRPLPRAQGQQVRDTDAQRRRRLEDEPARAASLPARVGRRHAVGGYSPSRYGSSWSRRPRCQRA